MIEIENIKLFKVPKQRKKNKKTIILLTDTKRRVNDYLLTLNNRKIGGAEYAPHFIISKTGNILSTQSINNVTCTFDDDIDKKIIKISLENLGWLKKDTILNVYKNWINTTYRLEPYEFKWRGYYYWDKYTQKQYDSLLDLIEYITIKENIPYNFNLFGDYKEFSDDISGIVSKSNFSDIYTDINPSIKLFEK